MSQLNITRLEVRDREYPKRWDPRAYREYNGKPRCYIFPKGETVLENLFVGRRARPYELYKQEVIPAVKAAIVEKVVDMGRNFHDFDEGDIRVNWSRHAGCSCGCSPGFIITITRGDPQPFDVYVDVEAADDAATVKPEARGILEDLREQVAEMQASQQTGRGPSGKLRNFKAMSGEKFEDVANTILRENNDPEAIEAVTVEAVNRGISPDVL